MNLRVAACIEAERSQPFPGWRFHTQSDEVLLLAPFHHVQADLCYLRFREMLAKVSTQATIGQGRTEYHRVREAQSSFRRVAQGEKLSFAQKDIQLRGHAIECRINAEDPDHNFRPNPGRISAYLPPGGPGVRIDSHVYTDYEIPPYYD